MESEDDIQLLPDTLLILEQFLKEKESNDSKFEELKQIADKKADVYKTFSMLDFKEDWQLSQFWYTLETSEIIAQEAISQTESNGSIGFWGR